MLLLEEIKKTGSITHAAKELKMSYRQAWQMVENMNQCASEPLVEKKLGGRTEGGAIVTKAGENAMHFFHNTEQKIKSFAEIKFKNINF